MNEPVKIALILGTARHTRESEKVAAFVRAELTRNHNNEIVFADVADYLFGRTIADNEPHPLAEKWRAIAQAVDGFLIISPEYNHGYPGELKMFLDCAYSEYTGKPVALISVSSGSFGGVRMVEHLRPSLIKMGMVPLRSAIHVGKVEELFDHSGAITDPSYATKVSALYDELVSYARTLRTIRK